MGNYGFVGLDEEKQWEVLCFLHELVYWGRLLDYSGRLVGFTNCQGDEGKILLNLKANKIEFKKRN